MLHAVFPMDDQSRVGEARRASLRLAANLGFDDVARDRVALVVTELGTNLQRHAALGRILLSSGQRGEQPFVEIVSIDGGPGMSDMSSCLVDGYSTSSTPGTGLGAARRQSSEFSFYSQAGKGTVICARVSARAFLPAASAQRAFEVGGICIPAPGEAVSGDAWSARVNGNQAYVLVSDGLGHGPDAAAASQAAVFAFQAMSYNSPSDVVARAHVALRGTRGAALGVAMLDASAGKILFSGAGNISGRVVTGIGDRAVTSQNGTVGIQIRTPQNVEYPWPEHAIVVLYSDGLLSHWSLDDTIGVIQCDTTVIAAWLVRENFRGRDDCTVVVMRRRAR